MNLPVLTLLILIPGATALLIAFMPAENRDAIRGAALAGTLLTLASSIGLVARFQPQAGFQLRETAAWIPQWGISYRLGVDGVSLFLVVLTALVMLVSIGAAWEQ